MSSTASCYLISPLSWIPQEPLAPISETSLDPCWYLGGKNITFWCKSVSTGLGDKTQRDLIERVNWVVEATLHHLTDLKKFMPNNPQGVEVVAVKYKKQVHNLFFTQNTILFNLPQTTSGTCKNAIPMVNLQTGEILMRLRVKDKSLFERFEKEIALQKTLSQSDPHERILSVLTSFYYKSKYFYETAKTQSSSDNSRRLSFITQAYKYNLHHLCSMMAFTEFFKLSIALDAAKALEHIHNQGHCHNDFKAMNIFFNGEKIVVADFGLSTPIESREKQAYLAQAKELLSKGISITKHIKENLTTPYIASPELPETFYTQASDVFAYGVTLVQLCRGEILFPKSLYTDKFYHSKVTKSVYEKRLEDLLGPRCFFDCLENIARDALSYRAEDRPSITAIIERLSQLRSHFPASQVGVLPPKLLDIEPLTSLHLWHTEKWKKYYLPLTHHFSRFNYNFSFWMDTVLSQTVLSQTNKLKFLLKAKRLFEELGPNRTMYKRIQEEYIKTGHEICYISIADQTSEFLGRILVVKSRVLYPSPTRLRSRHFTVRDTFDLETGSITNVVMMNAKTPTGTKTIELRQTLPDHIRYHPSLVPIEGVLSYQSQKGVKTAHQPGTGPETSKTTLFYRRCAYSYKEALSSPSFLTPINLWNWALNLTHLLFLLHNQNLLLGKIQLSEIGFNEKGHLVIKHLNGLTRQSEISEWIESPFPAPEHYLSIFGNLMSKKNDVRNIGLLIYLFEEQRRHPKPIDAKENFETIADTIFAISDQHELDSYLDARLSPHDFGIDCEDFSSILRGMLDTNPETRFSSQEAYLRLQAMGIHKKYAFF